jgi:hypothetical protein
MKSSFLLADDLPKTLLMTEAALVWNLEGFGAGIGGAGGGEGDDSMASSRWLRCLEREDLEASVYDDFALDRLE